MSELPKNHQSSSSHKFTSPATTNREQPPVYKKIGGSFKIDKQKYFGSSIASAHSVYLVMSGVRNDLATGIAGGVGGLLGGLLWAIFQSGKKVDPISSCSLAEIDPSVLNHPDWPLKVTPKNQDFPVLIIPREDVTQIKHPSFTNLLEVHYGWEPVTIEYALLSLSLIHI